MGASSPIHSRKTAHQRTQLRARILALKQGAFDCARIGRAEGLSRERTCQIAAQGVDPQAGGSVDRRRLTAARQLTALRAAVRIVAKERFESVDKLITTIDRFDKLAIGREKNVSAGVWDSRSSAITP